MYYRLIALRHFQYLMCIHEQHFTNLSSNQCFNVSGKQLHGL